MADDLLPAKGTLELFDAGCDSKLKFFDAPESYQFGQFVDLVVNYDGRLHQFTFEDTRPTTARAQSERPFAEVQGTTRRATNALTFPLQSLGKEPAQSTLQRLGMVRVDIDNFLADPMVEINGKRVPVQLSEDVVRAFMARRPLVVTVPNADGAQQLIVAPSTLSAEPALPAVDHWIVEDTATFIMRPFIPAVGGSVIRVPLSRDTVQQLRTGSGSVVTIGGRNVTLIPSSGVTSSQSALRRVDDTSGGGLDGVDDDPGVEPGGTSGGGTSAGNTSGTVGIITRDNLNPSPGASRPSPTSSPQDAAVPNRQIAVTLFLPWQQVWTLQGYTRGRLIQSIGLAPLEETTIEVFSWDRRRRALDQTAVAETEQFGETSDTTRDATSVYNQLQTDKEFELQGGGGIKATYNYGTMLTIEANGSINAANREKLAQLGRRSQDHLQESIIRASTRVKTSRTTRITESAETGREDRVTRRLRNPNRCAALTINYFDVHAAYDVVTSFVPTDARLCVLVDNPIDYSFRDDDELVVRSHETALRNALLDPALAAGFDGIRQGAARRVAKTLLEEADIERQKIEDANNLKAGQAGNGATDEIATAKQNVVDALTSVGVAAQLVNDGNVYALMNAVDDQPESQWRGSMATLGLSAQRWLFKRMIMRSAQSLFTAATALGQTPTVDQAASLVAAMDSYSTISADTLLNPPPADVEEVLTPVIQQYTSNGFEWNWWWGFFKDNSLRRPDDAGLMGLLATCRRAYSALLTAQQRASALGGGPGGAVNQQQDRVDALSSADRLEMAFPVGETATARERADALMAHLKEFKNYYNYAILLSLPPVELLQRLTAPLEALTVTVGMFEPRVVAMRGNRVAIPLLVDVSPEIESLIETMIAEVNRAEASTRRVTLPTSGLVTDLRVGTCSGCEEKVEQERTLQLRALAARIELDEIEAKRRQARLDANPPDLGATELPTPFVVRVEQTPAPGPPTA